MQNTKYCVVTTFNLQLMEVGVTMGTGQTVQLNVVEVSKQDLGHAATLPLLEVELIVREMPNRNKPVTLTLAQVKLIFLTVIRNYDN